MGDSQSTKNEVADRFTHQYRYGANDERACNRVRQAMHGWIAADDPDQRLEIHQHLRPAKDHEAEATATRSFECRAGAEMKRRERHVLSASAERGHEGSLANAVVPGGSCTHECRRQS